MKKVWIKLTAFCLCAMLLLAGCGLPDLESLFWISYEDMDYARPDITLVEQYAEEICNIAPEAEDVDALMEKVWAFYEEYTLFYTHYFLANIRFSKDLTDIYWEQEYTYCMERCARVDAAFQQVCYALADCPLREALEADEFFGPDYFDDYQGDSYWDDTFIALLQQETALMERYYDLSEQALAEEYYSDTFFETYGRQMTQLYVELVALRQDIAQYAGYGDYPSFAYDFYYYRDYTPNQAQQYLQQICQELVPLYCRVDMEPAQQTLWAPSTEDAAFAYVRDCAQAMGGTFQSAFRMLEQAKLYDLSYSEKKFDTSFEVFLPYYGEPYIFVNPTRTHYDKLTFAHEFGHFCNDYASAGSVAGVDVAEIFSQTMEYLSLCYVEQDPDLTQAKMAGSLATFVEQAMYASFEHQVYRLEGEALTADAVLALYAETGEAFGFDAQQWDSRDFVLIPHLFTNPLYVVSYVVSNDAALQIYQLELQEQGKGLALFEANLASQEGDFLAFLEAAGLESPFSEGRVQSVRETLEDILE